MERVWVRYGSGIALGVGIAPLTCRTVAAVKDCGNAANGRFEPTLGQCYARHECLLCGAQIVALLVVK